MAGSCAPSMEAAVSTGGRSPLAHALEQAEHDVLNRLEGVRGPLAEAMASTLQCDAERAKRLLGRSASSRYSMPESTRRSWR